jgi:hypothetical protein
MELCPSLKYLSEQKCQKGCEGTFTSEPYEEIVSALRVEFRDVETSNDPPTSDVILFNDFTTDVPWNEPIKITGSIERINVKSQLLPHIFVGLRSEGAGIGRTNEVESIEIEEGDPEKVQEFLTKNKGRVLEALAELYAPSHIGDDDAKRSFYIQDQSK